MDELEELLRLASEKDEEKKTNIVDDVVRFLLFCGIEPGKNKVTIKQLYLFYNKWSTKKKPRLTFVKTLTKYVSKKHTFVFLNKTIFELEEKFQTTFKSKKHFVKNSTEHYKRFANFYNLKSGTNWIDEFILYYLYKQWVYKNKGQKMSNTKFISYSKLFFKHKFIKDDNRNYFGVNGDFMTKLTPQRLAAIERIVNEEREEIKTEK